MEERNEGNEGKEKKGTEEVMISELHVLLINHCLWADQNIRE